MHKLAGFQFFQINNGDPKLGGAMTGGGIAGFGRDDDRFGALAAETVPQDGKFVEGLGLDVAALQLRNSGMTPRAAMTSISFRTLPCPSTSSHRTTRC